jgi:hypothetical protein
MQKKIIDTIIIGCGVAGLGCARTLYKNKKNFLVITENIGGRICTSKNGQVNYGAYFVITAYKNVLEFVNKTKKLRLLKLKFHNKEETYSILRGLRHPLQLIKLYCILIKFANKYNKFRILCENNSQKEAIIHDQYYKELYFTNAKEFARQNNISDIAEKVIGQATYLCSFLPLEKISAFDFMRISLGLLFKSYEFSFQKDQAINGFKDKIIFDSIEKIERGSPHKIITKSKKEYFAKNLVIATPPHISQKLLGLKEIKDPVSAYLFNIKGTLKKEWVGQYELFDPKDELITVGKQGDDSYLVYSQTEKPNLKRVFEKYTVFYTKKWDPAFNMVGNTLLECKQGHQVYLIGDYNIIGLEEAYITGIYAANQIIKKE